jgi:hypothetical protein
METAIATLEAGDDEETLQAQKDFRNAHFAEITGQLENTPHK